jgi:hypothetical protein
LEHGVLLSEYKLVDGAKLKMREDPSYEVSDKPYVVNVQGPEGKFFTISVHKSDNVKQLKKLVRVHIGKKMSKNELFLNGKLL